MKLKIEYWFSAEGVDIGHRRLMDIDIEKFHEFNFRAMLPTTGIAMNQYGILQFHMRIPEAQ